MKLTKTTHKNTGLLNSKARSLSKGITRQDTEDLNGVRIKSHIPGASRKIRGVIVEFFRNQSDLR